MSWGKLAIGTIASLCLSSAALRAHHSVGINFDASKAFNLTGVVKELNIRNPHSQITVTTTDEKGMPVDWVIEWSDKNALVRRKVGYERMRPGDTVMIRVSPSKRLEHVGYFQYAVLSDKTVLRDCGAGALTQALAKGTEDVDCPQVER